MSQGTLNLPISEVTQRKLRALAMLTGEGVGEIESTLSGFLDEIITKKCAELLGIEQGVTFRYDTVSVGAETPALQVHMPPKPKSFADAHKQTAAPPDVEEAFSGIEIQDEVSGHSLSSDRDDQNNKSLEEQYNEAMTPAQKEAAEDEALRKSLKDPNIPNVGENAEAYLDAAMGEPENSETGEIPTVTRGYAGVGQYGERPRTATKSFESRLKRGETAKVQAYTGEED